MGLLGENLPYTFSPQIHAGILRRIGRTGEYGALEKRPEDLPAFFQGLRQGGYLGVNVTIPYKTAVLPFLDDLSPEAERIGAVNCVRCKGGTLTGYNTDYFGFGYTLGRAGIDPRGKRACVLGSGGAARAAAIYLKDAGAEVVIVSRDAAKAQRTFPDFEVLGYADLRGDILVNATPVGTWPAINASAVGPEALRGFEAAADLVYNPVQTLFLKTAADMGLKTADGIAMLAAQAVKSQEIWQNRTISNEIIEEIIGELT